MRISDWSSDVCSSDLAQIYEGANGIQALDLVGRKLGQNMGRLLRRFFHPVQAYVEAGMTRPELAEFVAPLAKSLSRLQQSTLWIAQQGLKDPEIGRAHV